MKNNYYLLKTQTNKSTPFYVYALKDSEYNEKGVKKSSYKEFITGVSVLPIDSLFKGYSLYYEECKIANIKDVLKEFKRFAGNYKELNNYKRRLSHALNDSIELINPTVNDLEFAIKNLRKLY